MATIAKSQVLELTIKMIQEVLPIKKLTFNKNLEETLGGLGLSVAQVDELPSLIKKKYFLDVSADLKDSIFLQATTLKDVRDKIWEVIPETNKVPCITKIQALERTKRMLVELALARIPVYDYHKLYMPCPLNLGLDPKQIRVLQGPIEHQYFHDVCAQVDADKLVEAEDVSGLSDTIWDGIPGENKCSGED